MDNSKTIFGNEIDNKTIKKGYKSKKKFIKKYGDDSETAYCLKSVKNDTLYNNFGVCNLELSENPMNFDKNSIVIGTIRMGFGHYRISMALASWIKHYGYTPYWFNLNGFAPSTGSMMVQAQNDLYSLGSRLSQKFKLFNKLIWDPMNCEGFRKLTYNSIDQRNAELLVPLYNNFPKDIPFVATHAWAAQGAIHSGLTNVVNAIPDNWPMALHLAEGSLHTVQTPFAYMGYKKLNGMAKNDLLPMNDESLVNVGHYIDYELVHNLQDNTAHRLNRLASNAPLRLLMTIGGAGAQYDLFKSIYNYLLPYIVEKKVTLLINFGDHKVTFDDFNKLKNNDFHIYENDYEGLKKLANDLNNDDSFNGIYTFYNTDIFKAVYGTNLLMPVSDLLITKPSELAFYPIPKLMIKRVGGHEAYGAIHTSELGDGTMECDTLKEIKSMLKFLITDESMLKSMNQTILKLNEQEVYDGAKKIVELLISKNK